MPFREDIQKIEEYDKAMDHCTSIFHIEATTFSLYFCMIASKGVKFASAVMESAALRFDNKQDEVSSCTTKQTLTMYVSIFVGLVKDAYDKKFNDESIFALLGAFRGVAAVGHILLQDTLANFNYTEYSSSNCGVVLDSERVWCEFEQKMNNLEAKFRAVSKSTKAYEILRPTMTDAMKFTMLYISAMVAYHEKTLGYVPGTKGRRRSIKASGDGEPGAFGTSSGSM
ncbi:hypothetical protein HU200_057749 [Digitaria exilis]|uniref:Uncharacterized protein n=1 Tax=Digitaria exilis TaxID=1010633 RepID=A0A835AE58_9POAL|nr:hypothetical protein HU200_057749 [Digitaria exilis]